MTCLSCENIVSNLFQMSLNQHLWLKSLGLSSLTETATIQEWSLASVASGKANIHPFTHNIIFDNAPIWLWFEVWPQVIPETIASLSIELPSLNGNKKYKLNTTIYHGMNHFTYSFVNR